MDITREIFETHISFFLRTEYETERGPERSCRMNTQES